MSGGDFIVDEGLKSGDMVIVNGLQKARPGAVVKPMPWTPGAPLLAAPPAAKPPAPGATSNEEKK
jgi:membrane fusion protein (multidrug efflux system)